MPTYQRVTTSKLDQLRDLLRSFGSCVVAYSGGVDSTLLARVAHDVLGQHALAVIADSPSLPRRELAQALAIAQHHGFAVRVIRTEELRDPNYQANPLNRCYFCKHELFRHLTKIAQQEGYAVVVCGENASDTGDFRPGTQAGAEFGVRAPLKEVGLTKAEIRDISAQLGLPTADKPELACLSSRVPYGEPVSPEKLAMIEQAEDALHDLGFRQVRVRHHELRPVTPWPGSGPLPPASAGQSPALPQTAAAPGSAPVRHLARIELEPSELGRLLENGLATRVAEALQRIGYTHVTLDLLGYRRGSLNLAAGLSQQAKSGQA
jgi:uncharacterized protein